MDTNQNDVALDADKQPAFNDMQDVKRRFYALRNGALAEQMRRGGLNYRVIFGLNVPQLKDIAGELTLAYDDARLTELAVALWANEATRESRLLAPMIMPVSAMTEAMAMQWMQQAQTVEVVDALCHALLRKLPFAELLVERGLQQLADDNYAPLRLLMNLLVTNAVDARRAQQLLLSVQPTANAKGLAARIAEEIELQTEA
jgi:3-methyladenine DNA glycosylase AlkD